jgi:3',5'-cyclic AMP phosphodiesterase CpdA
MTETRASLTSGSFMPTIAQLSDLHLLCGEAEQGDILAALVDALRREVAEKGRSIDLLAITGDVFDSASRKPERSVNAFLSLHADIRRALGRDVPTVIVPGNHDRRRAGLLGPFRREPFVALRDALRGRAFVHGSSVPFLAQVVPHELHGMPAWVVAFDSTYLPSGLISAGGSLRQEDILHAAAAIGSRNPDWPVLFLLHHHMIPTPLTDVGVVKVDKTPQLVRWGVQHLLPTLIANADREEMTMTALGAGTALSTLHALGRAVLVLHGHKHYATARLSSGLVEGQGDVLVVSAGSCGTVQSWFPTTAKDAATLWPSFNLIELTPERVRVDVVSFGYRGDAAGMLHSRPLVSAQRQGPHWRVVPVKLDGERDYSPSLERNELYSRLVRNATAPRWDCFCERRYDGRPDVAPERYGDAVDAVEDSDLVAVDEAGAAIGEALHPPTQLTLERGQPTRYRITRAYCRTVTEAERMFGLRWAPYAWQGLMNRYACDDVRLEIRAAGTQALRGAFASETDLGTGLQRPLALGAESNESSVIIRYRDCPPRTLIRVYWPLEAG